MDGCFVSKALVPLGSEEKVGQREGLMATATPVKEHGFGATSRKDPWWLGPMSVLIGLSIFVIYSTWAGLQGNDFEIRQNTSSFAGPAVAPYLSPFYSPLLYDRQSPHAWFHEAKPGWWPESWPFSAAILILAGPNTTGQDLIAVPLAGSFSTKPVFFGKGK